MEWNEMYYYYMIIGRKRFHISLNEFDNKLMVQFHYKIK